MQLKHILHNLEEDPLLRYRWYDKVQFEQPATLAQRIEQIPSKDKVPGSNPGGGANERKG